MPRTRRACQPRSATKLSTTPVHLRTRRSHITRTALIAFSFRPDNDSITSNDSHVQRFIATAFDREHRGVRNSPRSINELTSLRSYRHGRELWHEFETTTAAFTSSSEMTITLSD